MNYHDKMDWLRCRKVWFTPEGERIAIGEYTEDNRAVLIVRKKIDGEFSGRYYHISEIDLKPEVGWKQMTLRGHHSAEVIGSGIDKIAREAVL